MKHALQSRPRPVIDTQMARLMLLERAKTDRKLNSALHARIDPIFYSDIKNRALTQRNVIISIYGPQGGGKSLAAFYIANEIWSSASRKAFNASHVSFTDQELLEKFSLQEKGVIYTKDEQIDTFGIGSDREQSAVENVGAVARAQKLSLIYCSPDLRLHNVHYILEATGIISEKSQTAMFIVYDGQKETPIGWIKTHMPSMSTRFWDEYNLRKDNFITAVRMQQPIDRTAEYEKMAEEFIRAFIIEKQMKFPSKKSVRTLLMQSTKKNLGEKEWWEINNLIDMKCRERNIVPYTFTQW